MFSRKMSYAAVCVAALFGLTGPVQATVPVEKCDVTLFKTMISDHVQQESYVFVLDQVTQDNYSEMKTSIGASVPGYFDGNFDQFKAKRDQLYKSMQFQSDQKYSRDYAISTLTRIGLEAYNNCLRSLRQESELTLMHADDTSVDSRITFAVDLFTQVALQGPVLVDVFGAGRVLSAYDHNTMEVNKEADVVHIAIKNLVGSAQFTIARPDRKRPFRITGQVAGKVAKSIEFGPYLEAVPTEIESEISTQNTTIYLARRLQPGTDNYDFVWATNEGSPNNNSVPRGTTFVGKACLCASEQRVSWNAGFQQGGTCLPPQDPSKVRLLPETVKFSPAEFVTSQYSCGGLPQSPVKLLSSDDQGVCYGITLSLNAPASGSVQCDVSWKLIGKIKKMGISFVSR